jgi:hypothetical protein
VEGEGLEGKGQGEFREWEGEVDELVQADRPRSRKTETPLLKSVPTNAEREDPGHRF